MLLNSGYRSKFTKVENARKRKKSSVKWLSRHLNDPYVAKSKLEGYRSRSAYKLIEINDKFKVFMPGLHVVDLGSAPGGWSQVAAKLVKSDTKGAKNKVIAIDLLPIENIPGVRSFQGDFLNNENKNLIVSILDNNLADIVISDMAANTIGHSNTDHIRIMELCETAFNFALNILKPGGSFIAKILKGGTENELLTKVKKHFKKVKHFKPKSSRTESSEFYLIALEKRINLMKNT